MEKNKKIILVVAIGLLVAGLLIATMFIGGEEATGDLQGQYAADQIIANAQRESDAITESQMKVLEEINMETYLNYYNGPATLIVFVGRPTCPYCEITKPIISKIAKDYDLVIKYLNTDNFTDDDKAKFVQHNEMFNEGYGTPLILIIGNGEIKTSIEGLTDTEHFLQFFRSAGMIQVVPTGGENE